MTGSVYIRIFAPLHLGGDGLTISQPNGREKLVINGGKPLKGEVTISGAKNAAVAILPATLLADGISVIENLPNIDDVTSLKNTLNFMGAKAEMKDKSTMIVDPRGIKTYVADTDMISRMRASYYLLGVLLGRFGKGGSFSSGWM